MRCSKLLLHAGTQCCIGAITGSAVTGNCPLEARSLGIGCLAKPYTNRMLRSALETVDRKIQGKSVRRLPSGLTLYEDA